MNWGNAIRSAANPILRLLSRPLRLQAMGHAGRFFVRCVRWRERLIFIVSRTLAAQRAFSHLAGRALARPSRVFPGRYGSGCGKTGRSAEFGAWLRRPVRVGFRTRPDGLEGLACSVSPAAATAPEAPRRARAGRPRSPRASCPAPRRRLSPPPARRAARGRRRPGPPAACRWRTCRPGRAWARS